MSLPSDPSQTPPAKRARVSENDVIDLTVPEVPAAEEALEEMMELIASSGSDPDGLHRTWDFATRFTALLSRCREVDPGEFLVGFLVAHRARLEKDGPECEEFLVTKRLFKFIARESGFNAGVSRDPVAAYMGMIGGHVPKIKVLKMFAECGMRLTCAVDSAETLVLERAIRHSDAEAAKYILSTSADILSLVSPRIWTIMCSVTNERVQLRAFVPPATFKANTEIYFALEPYHIVNNIPRAPVGGGVPTEEAEREGVTCRVCLTQMRPDRLTYTLPCGHNEVCASCFMSWNPRHTCITCRAGYCAATDRFQARRLA